MATSLQYGGWLAPGWVFLGSLLAIVFAFWSYRFTNPPMSKLARAGMALLRGLVLIAVWLLATGFELHWVDLQKIKSRVVVLLDQSASMRLVDGAGNRFETSKNIISQLDYQSLSDSIAIEYYAFSGRPEKVNRDAFLNPPNGGASNLESALLNLDRTGSGDLDALVLITDGAFNKGGSSLAAAKQLHAPVYVIAVGDSLPQKDVQVRGFAGPARSYVGEKATLETSLSMAGVEGELITVQLTDENGDMLESRRVTPNSGDELSRFSFSVTPHTPGLNTWTVTASSIPGEVDHSNNSRQIAIQVEDRRRRILLFSGRPDVEISDWVRALEDDPDTDVEVVIGEGEGEGTVRGEWYDIPFDSLDAAIIVLAGPFSRQALNTMQSLASSRLPMMVVTGASRVDRSALGALLPRVGAWVDETPEQAVPVLPQREHAIFTLQKTWLPSGRDPQPVNLPDVAFRKGIVLAVASKNGIRRPAVLDMSENGVRTLVIAAEGIGGWSRTLRPMDPEGGEYYDLLNRILRWLTSNSEAETIVLQASQSIVGVGEEMELLAYVSDEALRPLRNLTLNGRAVDPDGDVQQMVWVAEEAGVYKGLFTPDKKGRWRAEVWRVDDRDRQNVGRTEFMVQPFRLEYVESRMRPDRLRDIAEATGGSFLLPEKAAAVSDLLPRGEGVQEQPRAWRPFGRWLTLLLVSALFGLEILIRTRRGMP